MISEKKSTIIKALQDGGSTIEEISKKTKLQLSSVRRYLRHAKNKKTPKILLLDIETAPVHVRVWGLFKQRIPYQNVIKDWFKICWAAKWLEDSSITMSDCVNPIEAVNRDDSRITYSVWKIINDADVVIGHNINRFDLRKIMARFVEHGLPKPKPYRTVDTLLQSRKHFAFSAHNLDYLNSIFSLRLKEDNDYQLWIDCEAGDSEALSYMLHYCKSDVNALEDLYHRLRPYMTSFPNLSIYVDNEEPLCPYCLSNSLVEDGFYTTNVSKFQSYRCLKCGATPRGRKSLLTKGKRDSLLISTVR